MYFFLLEKLNIAFLVCIYVVCECVCVCCNGCYGNDLHDFSPMHYSLSSRCILIVVVAGVVVVVSLSSNIFKGEINLNEMKKKHRFLWHLCGGHEMGCKKEFNNFSGELCFYV